MRQQIEKVPVAIRSVKGWTAVAVTAVLLGVTLSPQASVIAGEQGKKSSKDTRPAFYLTQEGVEGDRALAACAPGYHMASLWEIIDPSNLRYDSTLGVVEQDGGSGPPGDEFGWVRTGRGPSTLDFEGLANCNAWTSSVADHHGTVVNLRGVWRPGLTVSPISPWSAVTTSCGAQFPVWCTQD